MQINLIAVGRKMPEWVQRGYDEYASRLPQDCRLVLKEVAAGKRLRNSDTRKIVREEGERMLAAVENQTYIVALDERGACWSTEQLAGSLQKWLENYRQVALLVGGPEGLAPQIRARADEIWSLSKLTFPHPVVRVLVAEQIYRAYSVLNNHPYHRE